MIKATSIYVELSHVDNEVSSTASNCVVECIDGDGMVVVTNFAQSGAASVFIRAPGSEIPITADGVYEFWTPGSVEVSASIPGEVNGSIVFQASIYKRNP